MSLKPIVFSTLNGSATLSAIVGSRIYQRNKLGVQSTPQKPQKPFVLVGELPGFPTRNRARDGDPSNGQSKAMTYFPQFFCYDNKGSYKRIEEMLEIIEFEICSLEGTKDPISGRTVMMAKLDTTSQDYDDDDHNAFVKHETIRMVGSTPQL